MMSSVAAIRKYISDHYNHMVGSPSYRAQVIADLHNAAATDVKALLIEMGMTTMAEAERPGRSPIFSGSSYRPPHDTAAILTYIRQGWDENKIAYECGANITFIRCVMEDAQILQQIDVEDGFNEEIAETLYSRQRSDKYIADFFQITPQTVQKWRMRRGMPGVPKRSKLCTEKAMALYRQGLSDAAIGRQIGVSASTIQKWRKNNGMPKNNTFGRKAGNQ